MTDETENKTVRVQLLMTPTEVASIDDWGFANRIRTRAEAIRRLCQIGLAVAGRLGTLEALTHSSAEATNNLIDELHKFGVAVDPSRTVTNIELQSVAAARHNINLYKGITRLIAFVSAVEGQPDTSIIDEAELAQYEQFLAERDAKASPTTKPED